MTVAQLRSKESVASIHKTYTHNTRQHGSSSTSSLQLLFFSCSLFYSGRYFWCVCFGVESVRPFRHYTYVRQKVIYEYVLMHARSLYTGSTRLNN